MGLPLIATPAAADANSFLTLVEALEYFEGRAEVEAWEDSEQEAMLIMATRLLVAKYSLQRKLIRMPKPTDSYYLISPTWTGLPTTTTQALPWPRTGMFNRIGVAIGDMIIPQELKDATAEYAAHLAVADRSFDSDAFLQGLKSVAAGSVSVSFKDNFDAIKLLPDVVFDLLVPSWLTDEQIEYSNAASFHVVA